MIEAKERLEWRCCFPFWAHVRVCWGAGLADLLLLLLLLLASLVTSSSFFFFFTSPFSLYSTTVCYFVLLVFSLSLNCFVFFFVCLFSSIFLSSLVLLHCWLSWPHAPPCRLFCLFFFFLFPCCLRMCVEEKENYNNKRQVGSSIVLLFFFPPPLRCLMFQCTSKATRRFGEGKKEREQYNLCFLPLFFFFFEFNKACSIVAGRQIKHIYRLHC